MMGGKTPPKRRTAGPELFFGGVVVGACGLVVIVALSDLRLHPHSASACPVCKQLHEIEARADAAIEAVKNPEAEQP